MKKKAITKKEFKDIQRGLKYLERAEKSIRDRLDCEWDELDVPENHPNFYLSTAIMNAGETYDLKETKIELED